MKNFRNTKKGIILIIVLWVLFFLAVTVLSLGYKNRINIRLRSLSNDELKAFYLAKEGINRVIVRLFEDEQSFDSLKDVWNKKFNWENNDGMITVEVVDEDRLLNINLIGEEILKNMKIIYKGITEDDIKAINDMRPFNIVKEFEDIITAGEDKFYTAAGMEKIGLHELITTFTDGKLNINTAREELLLMVPNMTQSMVEAVVERRINSPFEKNETLSEDLSLLGLTPAQVSTLVKLTKVNSGVFRIKAKAELRNGKVIKELETVIKRNKDKFDVLYVKEN